MVGRQSLSDSLLTSSQREDCKAGSDSPPLLISIQIAAVRGEGFVKAEREVVFPHTQNVSSCMHVYTSELTRCRTIGAPSPLAHVVLVCLPSRSSGPERVTQWDGTSASTHPTSTVSPRPPGVSPCVVSSSPSHSFICLSVHCSVSQS